MINEFQDDNLLLKENGYFTFYRTFWLIVSVREEKIVGRYSLKNDTLYFDWLGTDPETKERDFPNKGVIDTVTLNFWFVDEAKNKRIQEFRRQNINSAKAARMD